MNAMHVLTQRTGFCRVNRRRPCLICGRPDWCSYTRDERISVCMRVRDGARKINHQGGAIHVHAGAERIEPRLLRLRPRSPPDPAPGETRDRAYGELTRLSPSARYDSLLVTGENGLLRPGAVVHP